MLRNAFFATAALLWAASSYAQDACDDTFDSTCTDASITFCNAQSVTESFDCSTLGTGVTCGEPQCAGDGCTGLDLTNCIGGAEGSSCVGFGPLLNQDPNDDNAAASVLCSGDLSCAVAIEGQNPVDRCVAHVGAACAAGGDGASCSGTNLSICLQDQAGTLALASNIVIDCALLGGACGEQECECDEQCGNGSVCANGFCDFGVTCPTPLAQLDACPGGEGEGEGEGEANDDECSDDGDCDEGQVCNRGQCEDGGEEGGTCSSMTASTSAPMLSLLALLGVVPVVRRRRRG